MELSQQVVSLELAKRLKELRVKMEPYFWWVENSIISNNEFINMTLSERIIIFSDPDECFPAFTVAELGEMLPEDYISCRTQGVKYPDLDYKKYWLCYSDPDGCDSNSTQMEETEANARAKMLIWLIENKLINTQRE